MALIDEYRRRLAELYAAETKILQAQAYTIKDKELQRTNYNSVRSQIDKLESKIARLDGTKKRCRRGLPRDL